MIFRHIIILNTFLKQLKKEISLYSPNVYLYKIILFGLGIIIILAARNRCKKYTKEKLLLSKIINTSYNKALHIFNKLIRIKSSLGAF